VKGEFLLDDTLVNYKTAQRMAKEAIQIYNIERPHLSLNYETPAQRHGAKRKLRQQQIQCVNQFQDLTPSP